MTDNLVEFILLCGFSKLDKMNKNDPFDMYVMVLDNVPYHITLTNNGKCVRYIGIAQSSTYNTQRRVIGSDLGNIKNLADIDRLIKASPLYTLLYQDKFQALLNHMNSVARRTIIDEVLVDLDANS